MRQHATDDFEKEHKLASLEEKRKQNAETRKQNAWTQQNEARVMAETERTECRMHTRTRTTTAPRTFYATTVAGSFNSMSNVANAVTGGVSETLGSAALVAVSGR